MSEKNVGLRRTFEMYSYGVSPNPMSRQLQWNLLRGVTRRNRLCKYWVVEAYEIDGRIVESKKNDFVINRCVQVVLRMNENYQFSFDFLYYDRRGGVKYFSGLNSGIRDWTAHIDLITCLGYSGYWHFFNRRNCLKFYQRQDSSRPFESNILSLNDEVFEMQFKSGGIEHIVKFKSIDIK